MVDGNSGFFYLSCDLCTVTISQTHSISHSGVVFTLNHPKMTIAYGKWDILFTPHFISLSNSLISEILIVYWKTTPLPCQIEREVSHHLVAVNRTNFLKMMSHLMEPLFCWSDLVTRVGTLKAPWKSHSKPAMNFLSCDPSYFAKAL